MTREHRQQPGKDVAGDVEGERAEPTPVELGRKARQQQALDQIRSRLITKATHEYKETVLDSLLVFRGMCAGDAKAEAAKELEPDVAGAIKDKFVDKLQEKLTDGIKEGLEIGKRLGGCMTAAFSGVKSKLEGITKSQKKLTTLELIDHITSAVYEAMETYVERAEQAIGALPSEFLVSIYRELKEVEDVTSPEDSEESGSLKHGLETWLLEEKNGLPRTGGAIVHELAQHYYLEYRAELRATMPVHEQAGELKNIGKLGLETDGKAADAEAELGPHMVKSVEKDQRERARAGAV